MRENAIMPAQRARSNAAAFILSGHGQHVSIQSDTARSLRSLLSLCGPPDPTPPGSKPLSIQAFVAELCFNLINFCYWAEDGRARPGGNSESVRETVFSAFGFTPWPTVPECAVPNLTDDSLSTAITTLSTRVRRSALPMNNQRADMLEQIPYGLLELRRIWELCAKDEATEVEMSDVLYAVTGFNGDIFHKRLLLFFMLLYRIYGRCGALAGSLPLPADYQVPKVLRAAGVLMYSTELATMIDEGAVLRPGCLMEREIRAAAIIAVDKLASAAGTVPEVLDEWLWRARHSVEGRHHLTLTTDY